MLYIVTRVQKIIVIHLKHNYLYYTNITIYDTCCFKMDVCGLHLLSGHVYRLTFLVNIFPLQFLVQLRLTLSTSS